MVDSLFDLGNIQVQGQRQVDNVKRRQAAQHNNHVKRQALTLAGAEQARAVNEQAMQSAEATRAQQLGVLNGIEEELRRAQEAQALARSDNPLDRIKLWALQQTSQSYNREGNQARINWYTNAASAVGMGETIRQQGYADQLSQIQMDIDNAMLADDANLETLTLMETQGAELIEAYRTQQAQSLEYLQNQNAMQDAALQNVSDPQMLQDALTEAQNAPGGVASVGGVQLSAAKIQERIDLLSDREYVRTGRKLEAQTNILQTLTLEQLQPFERMARESPTGTATIHGVEVTLAQIDQRRGALKNMNTQELAMDLQASELIKQRDTQAQERVLRTMTVGELNELIQVHQGIDPETNQMYDMGMLTTMRDSKVAERTAQNQTAVTLEQIGDPRTAVTQAVSSFNAIPAAPGSQLAKVIENQKRILSTTAATRLFESQDPTDAIFGAQIVTAAQQAVEDAISAEAQIMSAGDKNLETAYNYQLRGQPVPAELVSTAVAELAKKNLPKDQWLTTGPNGTLSVYNRVYGETMLQQQQESITSPFRLSKAEMETAAHTAAMEAVKSKAASGLTEQLMIYQLGDARNPLHGKIGEAELLVLMRESDMSGAQAYQQASGISNEDMQALLSGAEANPDLAAIQQAHFLMKLEEKHPGLSEQYAAWWSSPARQQRYAQFDQEMAANSNSTFQQAAQWGLVRGDIPHMLTAQAMTLSQGRDVVMAQEFERQHQQYVTFGGQPLNQQLFLLQQDRDLSDQDKQAAMRLIINPLLEDAQRQGLNFERTNSFIEVSLQNYQTDDPTIRRLYTKLMNNRSNSLTIIEDFYRANRGFDNPFAALGYNLGRLYSGQQSLPSPADIGRGAADLLSGRGFQTPLEQETNQYPWWNQTR